MVHRKILPDRQTDAAHDKKPKNRLPNRGVSLEIWQDVLFSFVRCHHIPSGTHVKGKHEKRAASPCDDGLSNCFGADVAVPRKGDADIPTGWKSERG